MRRTTWGDRLYPQGTRTALHASQMHQFYCLRASQVRLAVTTVFLCYGGGVAMFWLHAIYRREEGPPISAPYHWLLDSTLGFVALSPAILLLLPLASHRLTERYPRLEPAAVGLAFALLTTPGPLLHYEFVGKGTYLARMATQFFGTDAGVVARSLHAPDRALGTECLLQFVVGLPVYIVLALIAFRLSERMSRRDVVVVEPGAGVRTFPVGRIAAVTPSEVRAVRHDHFDLDEVWRAIALIVDERRSAFKAYAVADRAMLPALRAMFGSRLSVGAAVSDDLVDIEVGGPSAVTLAVELAGLGLEVEVLAPPEVRDHLGRIGRELAGRYTGLPPSSAKPGPEALTQPCALADR